MPAGEGFWVGCSTSDRLWVQLVTSAESTVDVRPGMRLSFRGVLRPNSPDFAEDVGLHDREGALQLERQGMHAADAVRYMP